MRTWSRITEITWVQWEFSWSIPDGRAKPEQFGILVTLIQNCSVQLGKVSVLTLFSNCFCKKKTNNQQQHRPKSPRGDSLSNRKTVPPQEDLSCVGFEEEPDLVDLCDKSGQIWVHERCAAWTLASIAAKSSVEFTVDLTNQILSKVCYFVF